MREITRPSQRISAINFGEKNYKDVYRIVFDYHKQHNPPLVDREYWRDHEPGASDIPQIEQNYWAKAASDIVKISNASDLLRDMLTAVYAELEREYLRIRAEAREKGSKIA